MSFNCCLFKLKKDQLSSYYLSDLPDQNCKTEEQSQLIDPIKQPPDPSVSQGTPKEELTESQDLVAESLFYKGESNNFNKDKTDKNNSIKRTLIRDSVKQKNIDLPVINKTENNNFKTMSIKTAEFVTSSEENDKITEMPFELNKNSQSLPIYYSLKIRLKEGVNLAVRDLTGTSDPYVKFFFMGNCVYKSKIIFKNLNPRWNEEFSVKLSPSLLNPDSSNKINELGSLNSINTINDLDILLSKFKLKMIVYDYDRGFLNDDLIGYTTIDLVGLKENFTPMEYELEDKNLTKNEYLGLIMLDLSLIPKYKSDEKENDFNSQSSFISKQNSTNRRQSVLNIILIEGKNLSPMDDNGLSDPYVKFKLHNERYRSRNVRKTLSPRFLEQFQFYIMDLNNMNLHMSVHDFDNNNKSDFMGKANIDLTKFEVDKSHFLNIPLEDGSGSISLLASITGISQSYYQEFSPPDLYRDEYSLKHGYTMKNSFNNIEKVGWLRVKVIKAEGLASADINGKSDPFCSLQLINQVVQTQTEYKTLNPEWNRAFEFIVTDLHAILEVNVLDEDKNKVYEFLGKLEIPIINIQNGKRKTYALKDRKLIYRSKGLIELEMDLVYNPVKAVVKTFNPREEKYITTEAKFRVPVLKRNIMRVHNIVQGILNTINSVYALFKWENPVNSFISFIIFIITCLFTEVYMLPLFLLLVFAKNYIILKLKPNTDEDESLNIDFVDDEEDSLTMADSESKEQKKSFKDRLSEIQEICLKIQNTMDYIAGLGERVINTFNFTIPWLTWLAIFVLLIVSLLLYLIPLRYLILLWGINKFTKILRKPAGYVDNTEILDFLSRVPSKQEIYQQKELKFLKNSPSANSNTSPSNYKDKRRAIFHKKDTK